MNDNIKRVIIREAIVLSALVSIWSVTLIMIFAFVRNLSSTFFVSLNFYFSLLYCFYLLDRLFIWVIERFYVSPQTAKKRLIDSVVIIFILASALGYFLVALLMSRKAG